MKLKKLKLAVEYSKLHWYVGMYNYILIVVGKAVRARNSD